MSKGKLKRAWARVKGRSREVSPEALANSTRMALGKLGWGCGEKTQKPLPPPPRFPPPGLG